MGMIKDWLLGTEHIACFDAITVLLASHPHH